MPCRTRMKTLYIQGVLWLCLLNFGCVLSVLDPGYLDFDNLPDTNFSCVGKVIGGYYADLETNCQMFHVCTIGQLEEPMDIRFLCLNGTVFDQETRVCERVDEVDCSKSEKFYHLNLELYGNTAPPIVEEPDPTEAPPNSYTTPRPTTTTPRPTTTTRRTTRGTYYTTQPIPTLPPTTHATPKVITSNQFPVNSGPDIRFNPEEINFRLTPGSPPIIKSPSVSYQKTAYNGGDSRITVTTHTPNYHEQRSSVLTQRSTPQVSSTSTTQKPKSVVSYGLTHTNHQTYQPQQSYEYSYHTDHPDSDYHTDLPSSEYYHDNTNVFESKQLYSASTTKRSETNYGSSTSFPSSHKPPQGYNYQRTDKPLSLQLPLPLFPTLPPLTFSSPAPFSLQRHFEKKRSNDHQQHPRIVVSASASVSDASGRRLNYSLGTIGTSHILGQAPKSYDDYKESDVGLDPFFHDVPRVNNRKKRDVIEEEANTAKEETSTEEHTTHWIPPDYVDDNYEPLTYNVPENETAIQDNNLIKNNTQSEEIEYEYYEYVDDNYEAALNEKQENETLEIQHPTETTVASIITTEMSTEPSNNIFTQESTKESNTVTDTIYYETEHPLDTTMNQEEETTVPTTFADEGILNSSIEDITTTLPEVENRSSIEYDLNETGNIETTTNSANIEYQTTDNILTTVPSVTDSLYVSTTINSMTNSLDSVTTISNIEDNNEYTTSIATEGFSEYTLTTQEPETNTEKFDYLTDISVTALDDNEEQPSTTESYTTIDSLPETTSLPTSMEEKYQESTTPIVTTTEALPIGTTEEISTSTTRYSYLRTREPAYRRNSRTRPTTRHRFSSPSIHMSQSLLKLQSNKMVTPTSSTETPNLDASRFNNNVPESKLTSSYEERYSSMITPSTEAPNFYHDKFVSQFNNIVPDVKSTSSYEDVPITDAPLSKSANPTEPKTTRSSVLLPTTPITKTFFIPRRFTYDTTRSFNCFGKQMNKFYEDPRDCRLFHYCTPGYTETQVLDMKFVCDYGTYFNSDKLICTKIKPQRCK